MTPTRVAGRPFSSPTPASLAPRCALTLTFSWSSDPLLIRDLRLRLGPPVERRQRPSGCNSTLRPGRLTARAERPGNLAGSSLLHRDANIVRQAGTSLAPLQPCAPCQSLSRRRGHSEHLVLTISAVTNATFDMVGCKFTVSNAAPRPPRVSTFESTISTFLARWRL